MQKASNLLKLLEELKEKETEKIFLHKDKTTVKDQNIFMSYISKNKNIRRLS